MAMKHWRILPLVFSLLLFSTATPSKAQDQSDLPGVKEQADVDSANLELDQVYRTLLSKADREEQSALREAQRAWIKWRDAEAMYIARHGGAVGGSALRVDYAEAELKLINDRISALKSYASEAPSD